MNQDKLNEHAAQVSNGKSGKKSNSLTLASLKTQDIALQEAIQEAKALPKDFSFSPIEVKTNMPFPISVNMPELIDKLRDLNYGVPVAHHTYFSRPVPYSFSGKCVVSWLYEKLYQKRFTRDSLLPLAQELLNRRVFETVVGALKTNKIFDDSKVFYRYSLLYRRSVLVIGGGFAGAHVVKYLEKRNYYAITMVDASDHFEYIPSLPAVFEKPELLKKFRIQYDKIFKYARRIQARVMKITTTEVILDTGDKLLVKDYDHIVLATGSHYDISRIKQMAQDSLKESNPNAKEEEGVCIINGMSVKDITTFGPKIESAKSITVVGSGAVGIEVVGSLAAKYPQKQIILVSSAHQLLERFCETAHTAVYNYYTTAFKNNLKIILGERVESVNKKTIKTSLGRCFETDVMICCIGFKPNTFYLKDPNAKDPIAEFENHLLEHQDAATATAEASSSAEQQDKCPEDAPAHVSAEKDNASYLGSHFDAVLDQIMQATFEAEDADNESLRLSSTFTKLMEVDDHTEETTNDSVAQEELDASSVDAAKAMHTAIEQNKLELLKKIIELEQAKKQQKLNFDSSYLFTNSKCTLLHTAARHNRTKIMKYLMEDLNATVDSYDVQEATPLYHAVIKGNMRAVVFLISKGATLNMKDVNEWSPLLLAVKYNHFEIAKLLLISGADLHYKAKKSNTVLHMVCEEGNVQKAKYLLEKENARFFVQNRDNETPLMLALAHPQLTKYLIDYVLEFHPSKVMSWLCARDTHENNIVHTCVSKNYAATLMHIISKMPDKALFTLVNDKNAYGNSPLHMAVSSKNTLMAMILCMTEMVDITAKNKQNQTAREMAVGDSVMSSLIMLIPQKKHLMETFKIAHRDVDTKKISEEVEKQLENMDTPQVKQSTRVKFNDEKKNKTVKTPRPASADNAIPELPKEKFVRKSLFEKLFPHKDSEYATHAVIKQVEESDKIMEWSANLDMEFKDDADKAQLLKMVKNVYSTTSIIDNDGYCRVNKFLQVKGMPKLFACGDITNIKEEKTGQAARIHADLVANNIDLLELRKPLMPYDAAVRYGVTTLGPHRAIMTFGNKFVSESALLIKMKRLIEYIVLKGLK